MVVPTTHALADSVTAHKAGPMHLPRRRVKIATTIRAAGIRPVARVAVGRVLHVGRVERLALVLPARVFGTVTWVVLAELMVNKIGMGPIPHLLPAYPVLRTQSVKAITLGALHITVAVFVLIGVMAQVVVATAQTPTSVLNATSFCLVKQIRVLSSIHLNTSHLIKFMSV